MPPPSLSTTTIVGRLARSAQAEQAVGVVEEGDVADEQRGRAPPTRGPPRRRSRPRRRCRWRRGWRQVRSPSRARRTTRRRGPASTTRPPASPPVGHGAHAARVRRRLGRARGRRGPCRWPLGPAPRLGASGPARASGPRPRPVWPASTAEHGRVGDDTPARGALGVDPRPATRAPAPVGAGGGQPLRPAPSRPAGGRAGARPWACGRRRSRAWRSRSSKVATVVGRAVAGSPSGGRPARASPPPRPGRARPRDHRRPAPATMTPR